MSVTLSLQRRLSVFDEVRLLLLLLVLELLRHTNGPGLCELDSGPHGRALPKHDIDLLQVSAHCFWEQEVDRHGNACGDNSVHDVVLVANAADRYWCDHDNDKVPDIG